MKARDRRKIRYAIVGLGHLAQVAVLPAFARSRNSQVEALISGNAKKQAQLGRKYGVQHVYSYDQYEECLAKGIDAAYIVLPNHLHHEFTIRALKAGVHVMCEKPMAVTSKDCEEMIRAAQDSDRKLMIAYRLHFEAGNLEAIGTARSRRLGDLRFFTSEFAQQVAQDNIRLSESVANGGGPVYDMGVYCINAARHLFGAEPVRVQSLNASKDEPRFRNTEEMTAAMLTFPGDRVATFTVSFGAANVGRYTLVGTKGMLTVDPAYEYTTGINLKISVGDKQRLHKFAKRDQFAAEIDYFSECILNDKQPEPSGLEGLADVRIAEAIYQSSRTGQVVTLPPFPEMRGPDMRQEIHRPAHGKLKAINAASPSGKAA